MPKGTNQKFKLYRLAQIMLEKTDEEHYITMPEIMESLAEYDITADRKSIYTDLRDLSILGIEVDQIVFVGDRMDPDGNDYPAARSGARAVKVTCPNDTVKLCGGIIASLSR